MTPSLTGRSHFVYSSLFYARGSRVVCMNRRIVFLTVGVVFLSLVGIGLLFVLRPAAQEQLMGPSVHDQIQTVIDARLAAREAEEGALPSNDDGFVSVLLIGLDTRLGDTVGHCDVIQLIEVDIPAQRVRVTAVPRGTYSPLPGTGHLPSDYYVSNACGIGGLSYGISQIEKILDQKADHLVVVGFSEAIGAFRLLDLPTTETLQWLRMRQPYAIGEPQRAHNHSTFLKQLILKFSSTEQTRLQTALEYVLYSLLDTDLSFSQSAALVRALANMDLGAHPERIELLMKPAYVIQDIPYDPATLPTVLNTPFNPKDGPSKEEVQQRVLDTIRAGLDDTAFVERAFAQHAWLQMDDAGARESVHFALLSAYLPQVTDPAERTTLLADYVIEMEALGESVWAAKGRELLAAQ